MKIGGILLLSLLAACQDLPAASVNVRTADSSFVWPVENAELLLKQVGPGEKWDVTSPSKQNVTFEVTREYRSATNALCKRYQVSAQSYLACATPNWQPVRRFD